MFCSKCGNKNTEVSQVVSGITVVECENCGNSTAISSSNGLPYIFLES